MERECHLSMYQNLSCSILIWPQCPRISQWKLQWNVKRNLPYCWWFRNPKQPPGIYQSPINNGISTTVLSTGEFTRFLNHQQLSPVEEGPTVAELLVLFFADARFPFSLLSDSTRGQFPKPPRRFLCELQKLCQNMRLIKPAACNFADSQNQVVLHAFCFLLGKCSSKFEGSGPWIRCYNEPKRQLVAVAWKPHPTSRPSGGGGWKSPKINTRKSHGFLAMTTS